MCEGAGVEVADGVTSSLSKGGGAWVDRLVVTAMHRQAVYFPKAMRA